MIWRRLLILDLILLAALAAGVVRVRRSWLEFEAKHRVESVTPEKESERTMPAAYMGAASLGDWTEISVRNPFSFDRNDVSIVAPKDAAPAQPKPVLFGTMAIGNEWIAMLAPGQTGNRTSQPMKVGESLGSWQVVEIHDKFVVVAANGVRETVVMNDPTALVPRDYSRTLAGSAAPINAAAPPVASQPPQGTAAAATQASAPQPAPPAAGQPVQEMLQTPFGAVPKTKPQ